jgi:hypothetical protein
VAAHQVQPKPFHFHTPDPFPPAVLGSADVVVTAGSVGSERVEVIVEVFVCVVASEVDVYLVPIQLDLHPVTVLYAVE